jgi:hypothetical protein
MTLNSRSNARLPAGQNFGHAVLFRDTVDLEFEFERAIAQPVGARIKRQAEPESSQACSLLAAAVATAQEAPARVEPA